jgi:ribosomal protein L11 methyltransferase
MDYWKYSLECTPGMEDVLLAYCSEAAFDSFEEQVGGLNAYLRADADEELTDVFLADLSETFSFRWSKMFIKGENWNIRWESNFPPVRVGNFCGVRASFHPPFEGVAHSLQIQPRMAFGTGHHETTWQCMATMEALPIKEGHLLDYGCGTGILAILASRCGAASIEAVDIEEESYQNTLDNCAINGVANVVVRCGSLEAVEGRQFSGIMANINRTILLESLPELASRMLPAAWLLCSGILEQDDTIVTQTAETVGLSKTRQTLKGNWLCMVFEKNRQA